MFVATDDGPEISSRSQSEELNEECFHAANTEVTREMCPNRS